MWRKYPHLMEVPVYPEPFLSVENGRGRDVRAIEADLDEQCEDYEKILDPDLRDKQRAFALECASS